MSHNHCASRLSVPFDPKKHVYYYQHGLLPILAVLALGNDTRNDLDPEIRLAKGWLILCWNKFMPYSVKTTLNHYIAVLIRASVTYCWSL